MFPLWHIHYSVLAWMDGWLERVYVKTWWVGDRSTSDEDVAKPAKSTNTHRTRIRFNNTPVTVLVRFLYTSTRDSKKGAMICQQKSILVLCGIVGVHQSGTYGNRKSLQIKTYRRKSLYRRRRRWTLVSSEAVLVVLGLLPRTKQKSHRSTDLRNLWFSFWGDECSVGGEFGGCWVLFQEEDEVMMLAACNHSCNCSFIAQKILFPILLGHNGSLMFFLVIIL